MFVFPHAMAIHSLSHPISCCAFPFFPTTNRPLHALIIILLRMMLTHLSVIPSLHLSSDAHADRQTLLAQSLDYNGHHQHHHHQQLPYIAADYAAVALHDGSVRQSFLPIMQLLIIKRRVVRTVEQCEAVFKINKKKNIEHSN